MSLDELQRDEHVVREKAPTRRRDDSDDDPIAELARVERELEQQRTQCRVRGDQLAAGASSYCWLTAQRALLCARYATPN